MSEERERVGCDKNCGAFMEPVTLEEHKSALEHWMEHSYQYGCAHGLS